MNGPTWVLWVNKFLRGKRYTVSTTMEGFPEIDTPKPFSTEEAEKEAQRFPATDEHIEEEQ